MTTAAEKVVDSVVSLLEWVAYNASRRAIFRGQGRAEWKLTPRIARMKDVDAPIQVEKRMFNAFKRLVRPHLGIEPKNDLEWLALAQHHGLATRLLDWTTSPLAALWFAAAEYQAHGADARLWAFQPDQSVLLEDGESECSGKPFSHPSVVVIYTPQISPRITAQNGCFTLQPYDDASGQFFATDSVRNLITSVVIPKNCLPAILSELDRCGVNEMSLFPGIDGTTKYLMWRESHFAGML